MANVDFVAYDTETTGLSNRSEVIGFSICAEETKAFYVILQKWDVATNSLIPMHYLPEAADVLRSLAGKNLIMHNGTFDCMITQANFKISLIDSLHTDTMVLAHLLNENRRVGLKELSISMFGENVTQEQSEMKASILANGGTTTKDTYELYKADAYLIAKYGAKDALLTYKLFLALVPDLEAQGLFKFFYEEESMPLLRGVTYQLNTTGLNVDMNELLLLKKTLEAECLQAKDFINQEIRERIKHKYPGTNKKNVFNMESPSQLSYLLFGEYGLEFNTLTKEGKKVCKALIGRLPYHAGAKREFISTCLSSKDRIYQPEGYVNGKLVKAKKIKEPWGYIQCDKRTLVKLAHRYEWIKKFLEYKKNKKLLNTYVEGIQQRSNYGVIYPSFLQHGTTSGRYSSRDPNFQNLPRDDKRIKACIKARPGRVFVGADYSQLEPRIFAYYSKDARLLAAFDGSSDFYSVIGLEVYDISDATPQKDGSPDAFGIKYKSLRDSSKVIALASTYGATAHQLAPTTGKSIEDTQRDIDSYFEKFPGVAAMMLEAHKLAKTQGYVTNLFGRPRRMPEAKRIEKLYGSKSHGELPYEARKLLNLAVNHRIQSTGASIVNRAAIAFLNNCNNLGIEAKIVVQVHDSIIAECDKKDQETIALLLQDALESTTILEGITLEAIPKIGSNLAEV